MTPKFSIQYRFQYNISWLKDPSNKYEIDSISEQVTLIFPLVQD